MKRLTSQRTNRHILKTLLFFAMIFTVFNLSVKAQAQGEIVTLTFSDYFHESEGNNPTRIPLLGKVQRANKNSTTIICTNSGLGEQIDKAVSYATSVWGASILNCDTIFIDVEIADIEEDIRTEVNFARDENGTYLPTALKTYKNHFEKREHLYPDGIITINRNTSWDYNLNENISSSGKNLSYGIMRAIARILGFGSTVKVDSNDNYIFSLKRGYSVFDNLIVNSNGTKLNSIPAIGGHINEELKEYVNAPGQTFWLTGGTNYQLLSPPYSRNNPPFTFLADGNTLMGGKLETGDYVLKVDETTQAIMNELGWNVQMSPIALRITSDDVPHTGITSAYIKHRFRIEGVNSSTIQNPSWSLQLPLANGETQIKMLKDEGLSCTTSPITNEKQYKISQDGFIDGTINFTCTLRGQEINVIPFKVHFELKPFIEYAKIEKIKDNAPYESYDAYYKVKYRGAEKIHVSVEEEYSSKLRSWYVTEPYIAYGIADHITAPYYAWLDFTAENQYGKSVYTIELQPYGVVSESAISSLQSFSSTDNDIFEVYSVSGIKISTLKNLSDIDKISYKGILLIRQMRNGTIVKSFKFHTK